MTMLLKQGVAVITPNSAFGTILKVQDVLQHLGQVIPALAVVLAKFPSGQVGIMQGLLKNALFGAGLRVIINPLLSIGFVLVADETDN